MKSFGSDNHSGIHPDILAEIGLENAGGHAEAYGDDPATEAVCKAFDHIFETPTSAYFVFNGTGANILSLKPLLKRHQAVICAETAHIQVDECGAPEGNLGCKLITIPTLDGKLTPELVAPHLTVFGNQHHAQPRVISISEPTELGTLYRPEEIRALAELAHAHAMYLHVDGARFANAITALGISPRKLIVETGVDVLSFGGTKNGLMFGEAVVFLNRSLSADFPYERKNSLQLCSKMRFIAAQFRAYFRDDLWLRTASHANAMAQLLSQRVKKLPGVHLTQRVETNALFAQLPPEVICRFQQEYFFYVWDEAHSEVRWMTSFDTTPEDVDRFATALEKAFSCESHPILTSDSFAR